MQTSLVASITDVQIIFNGISPAFILAVSKLQKQLPEEIKLFNAAIDQNGINATIRDPLLSIANDLDSTQTNVVTMNSTANTIFSSRQTLIADQTTLGTSGIFSAKYDTLKRDSKRFIQLQCKEVLLVRSQL